MFASNIIKRKKKSKKPLNILKISMGGGTSKGLMSKDLDLTTQDRLLNTTASLEIHRGQIWEDFQSQ